MRITTKGQVTIPVRIREQAGLMPNTEVDFAFESDGTVRLSRAAKKGKRKTRGEELVEHFRKIRQRNPIKLTTDEIMALTRGERLVQQLTGKGDVSLSTEEIMALTRGDAD